MSALRFLYKKTLKRRDIAYEDLIIFPKTLGCYSGEVTGQYDEATANAVRLYKKARYPLSSSADGVLHPLEFYELVAESSNSTRCSK